MVDRGLLPQSSLDAIRSSYSVDFSARITIRYDAADPSTSKSLTGQIIEDWQDLLDHVDLPCTYPINETLTRNRPQMNVQSKDYTTLMDGRYPNIALGMKAIIDGNTYKITSVEGDSLGIYTKLTLEIATP